MVACQDVEKMGQTSRSSKIKKQPKVKTVELMMNYYKLSILNRSQFNEILNGDLSNKDKLIDCQLKDFLNLHQKASHKVKYTFEKKIVDELEQSIQLVEKFDLLNYEEIQQFNRMLFHLTEQNQEIKFDIVDSKRKIFNNFLVSYQEATQTRRNVLHENLFLDLIRKYENLSYLEKSSFNGFWINLHTPRSSENLLMSNEDYIFHSLEWSTFLLEIFGGETFLPGSTVSNFKEFISFLYQKTTFIEKNELKEFMRPILFD